MGRARITLYKSAFHLLLLTAVALCISVSAARADERQHKVEAAFLYSFFNYITWPGYTSPQELKSPVICVYGEDPILYYLEYVRVKIANERKLTLRVISPDTPTAGCHILFMRHRIPYRTLSSLDKETLTVFKPDDPLDRGGMIELSEDDERIAIKINQAQLQENGFDISSRLLELMQRVR